MKKIDSSVMNEINYLLESVSGLDNTVSMLTARKYRSPEENETLKYAGDLRDQDILELAKMTNFNTAALRKIISKHPPLDVLKRGLVDSSSGKTHWADVEKKIERVVDSMRSAINRRAIVERQLGAGGGFVNYRRDVPEGRKRQKVLRSILRKQAGIPRGGRR